MHLLQKWPRIKITQDGIKAETAFENHPVVISGGCQNKTQQGKTHQITLTPLFCIATHLPCLCPEVCSVPLRKRWVWKKNSIGPLKEIEGTWIQVVVHLHRGPSAHPSIQLGPSQQERHWNARACAKRGNKDDEGFREQVLGGLPEGTGVV